MIKYKRNETRRTREETWWNYFIMLLSINLASCTGSNRPSYDWHVPSYYTRHNFTRSLIIGGQSVTYNYNTRSIRNHNSGARYYMRNLRPRQSTDSLLAYPYQYDRRLATYNSGYGYRLKYDPKLYTVKYLQDYYYFPPMFQYYYFNDDEYIRDGRPWHLCRNNKTMWLLENQTSEFYEGVAPMVRLAVFDQVISDPRDSNQSQYDELNDLLVNGNNTDRWTVMDSVYINELLRRARNMDESPHLDLGKWTFKSRYFTGRYNEPSDRLSNSKGRTILAYGLFACPDGKDPDEIYCCGDFETEYCCTYEQFRAVDNEVWALFLMFFLVVSLLVVCVVCMCVKRLRQRYCTCDSLCYVCCCCCCCRLCLQSDSHSLAAARPFDDLLTTSSQSTQQNRSVATRSNHGYQPVTTAPEYTALEPTASNTYGHQITSVPVFPPPTLTPTDTGTTIQTASSTSNTEPTSSVGVPAERGPPTYESVMQSGYLSGFLAPCSTMTDAPPYVSASEYLAATRNEQNTDAAN